MYVSILVQTGKLLYGRTEKQHKCDTIFQVFSFKNKTKAQMIDLKHHIFLKQTTDSIHPMSESLKMKIGASYRLRMDDNNNTDISNNIYVMGSVFKMSQCLYGCFYFNQCRKMGPVYRKKC